MTTSLTPMMSQYLEVKEKCKDCILFFRIGDFYEMFFEDAKVASKELELVLTGKDCGLEKRAPMCGIPYHAAKPYISKLVHKGYKIAVCEQLEDPKIAKGIVKRGIIKVITPGTCTDSSFLQEERNNYVMGLFFNKKDNDFGLCFTDISTGEFNCTCCSNDFETVLNEISKFNPSEIIIQEDLNGKLVSSMKERFNISITIKDLKYFTENSHENVKMQFKDFDESLLNDTVIYAVNGLLNYIFETQKLLLSNINKLEYYNIVDFLSIDSNSRRNLELTETMREKTKKNSLLWVIDNTSTAMGARRIRKWLEEPLLDKKRIDERLDSVEEIVNNFSIHNDLSQNLKEVYDIERIAGKISSKSVNAKELVSLKISIGKIPQIKTEIKSFKSSLLKKMHDNLDELSDVFDLLDRAIMDNPSLSIKEGNIIKDGYKSEIDELRDVKLHGKEWIASLESHEKEVTGIKSLKVSYNKVFGYFIEITRSNLSLVPEGRYIRKQTLANAERYITPELKDMEDKILGAEDKLIDIEYQEFVKVRDDVEENIDRLKKSAKILSELDCLNSMAQTAVSNNYCKPKINMNGTISIKEGRHPVVEKMIPYGTFVSNDTVLDNEKNQMLLITGPNMAGKSTYMRQVALIVILAQMGSFVPAKSADISICDKIFTRIGASDDLANGKSTFMVEMWEVSNILKNATKNSLILLDEVGRGTSTYDGLSIAWAVIEYICKNKKLRCKTLFATHYHELTHLEGKINGLVNYCVAVKKIGDEIVFLRKIVPGGADESYGIEVAKLAGLPDEVTKRAREILMSIGGDKKEIDFNQTKKKDTKNVRQIGFLELEKDSLIKEISDIDIYNISPMESMNRLYDIIKKTKTLLK